MVYLSQRILQALLCIIPYYNSGKIPLIHIDLYRLENLSSAKEFFYHEEEEALQKSYLVIEWPELIELLIKNFWKEISYAKQYGRYYEIRDPKNLLAFHNLAIVRLHLHQNKLIIHKHLRT